MNWWGVGVGVEILETGQPGLSIFLLPGLELHYFWNFISSTISDPSMVQTSYNFECNGSHGDKNSTIKG